MGKSRKDLPKAMAGWIKEQMNEIELELKAPLKAKQALQDGIIDSEVTDNLKKAITSLDRGMRKADDTTKT